jgi:hypothetical protein
MTTIDQYQPCVCGSGKKFKFCKCGAVEHIPDLEKILRLMDGDQDLAALDRINGLLSKIPNASWLLALKAELTLSMQEMPSFVEATNRFLKLKPDNPLALIFRSMVCAFQDEPLETQARYLLEGLAESRENLSSHALFAVHSLVMRLSSSESSGMIGMWGELHETATAQNPQHSVLRDPSIHLACKSAPRLIDFPKSAPWIERLDEVVALSSAFRFEQSEKKLQSILRDYPGQAKPLSHLLRSQVAQLDRWPAIATAKKLAEHIDLSAQDRAYYRVLAWEYEQTPLQTPSVVRYGEIESDERLIEALSQLDEVRLDDMDESRDFMGAIVGDEVPAKRVYQVFDTSTCPSGSLKSFVGILAVYGKQTDKPARSLFMATDFPPYRPLIEKICGLLELKQEISDAPPYNQPYVEFLGRNRFIDQSETPWVSLEERGRLLVEDFLNLPQQVLDGQTPLEAIGDERKRANLQALLLHLEGSLSIVPVSAIKEIYQKLDIEYPASITVPADNSQFSMSSFMDLLRIDLSAISDSLLVGITQLCLAKGASRLLVELANEIIHRDNQTTKQGLIVAYSILLELDPDISAKLRYAEKMEEFHLAVGKPVGRYVLLRVNLLNQMGKPNAASELMLSAARKYQNDPEMIAFFQQMQALQQQSRGGDDLGTKMLVGAAERQASKDQSSIILPGQSQQPAGESKLWLPGS